MKRTVLVLATLLTVCLARECHVCEQGSVKAKESDHGEKMKVDTTRFSECKGTKVKCQSDQEQCVSASIGATITSTKDGKKLEAVFTIDALKACSSNEDTCEKFKEDLKAMADKESSDSKNAVTMNKCVVKKCTSDNCNHFPVNEISAWKGNSANIPTNALLLSIFTTVIHLVVM